MRLDITHDLPFVRRGEYATKICALKESGKSAYYAILVSSNPPHEKNSTVAAGNIYKTHKKIHIY